MSILKIKLTPMEPYFLGGERNEKYEGGAFNTKQSERKPYFIRSELLPSQTTLFGITRYLGIRNPKSDFSLDSEDKKRIGEAGYQLLSEGNAFGMIHERSAFGMIQSISPLTLEEKTKKENEENEENEEIRHYIPAPRNYVPGLPYFEAYRAYNSVCTMDGERWIPERYDAKAFEPQYFLCVENGLMLEDPFKTQVRTGIQRPERKKKSNPAATDSEEIKGDFFRREYVMLKKGFSFVWYVNLKDETFQDKSFGFLESGKRLVTVGQGKTGFAAEWNTVDAEAEYSFSECVFPHFVCLNGEARPAYYAYAASDIYYSGDLGELRKNCVLALANTRDHRRFVTNYGADAVNGRYTKGDTAVKLIKAGSVFIFDSPAQQNAFRELVKQSANFEHGQTAGFNKLIYIGEENAK